jgi:hypothetical protein
MSCLSLSELPASEREPAPSKLIDFNPLRPTARDVIYAELDVHCAKLGFGEVHIAAVRLAAMDAYHDGKSRARAVAKGWEAARSIKAKLDAISQRFPQPPKDVA